MENRPGQNVVWYCSICLYDTKSTAHEQKELILTVINGQLVCDDHAGYVQGGAHAHALLTAIKR
jgi:hypothetical protein